MRTDTTHRLILIRHAKTEPSAATDSERELTDRGERQSFALGEMLEPVVRGTVHARVSSAVRAVQTWRLAAARIAAEVTTEQVDALYTADADDLLADVRATGDAVDTVVIVGHNPTIAEVVDVLATGGIGSAYDDLRDGGYSPSTTAIFDVEGLWAETDSTTAELVQYVPPQA